MAFSLTVWHSVNDCKIKIGRTTSFTLEGVLQISTITQIPCLMVTINSFLVATGKLDAIKHFKKLITVKNNSDSSVFFFFFFCFLIFWIALCYKLFKDRLCLIHFCIFTPSTVSSIQKSINVYWTELNYFKMQNQEPLSESVIHSSDSTYSP